MYNENGQWLIVETSSRRDVVDTGEATFDMIIMELKLQRKPIFYLLNVIVPCTVILENLFLVSYVGCVNINWKSFAQTFAKK